MDGPLGDVGPHLLALELDHPGRLVGAVAGVRRSRAEPRDVQDAAAGRDDLTRIVASGARVGDLDAADPAR